MSDNYEFSQSARLLWPWPAFVHHLLLWTIGRVPCEIRSVKETFSIREIDTLKDIKGQLEQALQQCDSNDPEVFAPDALIMHCRDLSRLLQRLSVPYTVLGYVWRDMKDLTYLPSPETIAHGHIYAKED